MAQKIRSRKPKSQEVDNLKCSILEGVKRLNDLDQKIDSTLEEIKIGKIRLAHKRLNLDSLLKTIFEKNDILDSLKNSNHETKNPSEDDCIHPSTTEIGNLLMPKDVDSFTFLSRTTRNQILERSSTLQDMAEGKKGYHLSLGCLSIFFVIIVMACIIISILISEKILPEKIGNVDFKKIILLMSVSLTPPSILFSSYAIAKSFKLYKRTSKLQKQISEAIEKNCDKKQYLYLLEKNPQVQEVLEELKQILDESSDRTDKLKDLLEEASKEIEKVNTMKNEYKYHTNKKKNDNKIAYKIARTFGIELEEGTQKSSEPEKISGSKSSSPSYKIGKPNSFERKGGTQKRRSSAPEINSASKPLSPKTKKTQKRKSSVPGIFGTQNSPNRSSPINQISSPEPQKKVFGIRTVSLENINEDDMLRLQKNSMHHIGNEPPSPQKEKRKEKNTVTGKWASFFSKREPSSEEQNKESSDKESPKRSSITAIFKRSPKTSPKTSPKMSPETSPKTLRKK